MSLRILPQFSWWLLLALLAQNACAIPQTTFAETKFDLPADFPAEDLPLIAANQDQKPATETAAPAAPPPTPAAETPPNQQQTPPTPQIPPQQPAFSSSLPPAAQPSFESSSPSTTIAGGSTPAANNSKTPLPLLPNLVELPQFVQGGNVQPLTIPPSLIETSTNLSTVGGISTSPPAPGNQQTNNSHLPPTSPRQPIPPVAKLPPFRQHLAPTEHQLWFRDDIDTKNCPQNADVMARHFRKKFPKNLLRHQKETVLAELLAIRLKECARKQRENHWTRLDKALKREEQAGELEKLREREECRAGLIQEQIACMNVHSFSCQFIQPTFLFRLVPTRIIVQEARLAEDGAEKCRPFSGSSNNGNRKLSRRGK